MQAPLFHHTTPHRMTMMKRCLSIGRAACGAMLLLPLLSASLIAQEHVDWQPMRGPYGGNKPFVLFDRDSTGRIWGGSQHSSLYWSDDGGGEWHQTSLRRPCDLVVAEDGRILLIDDSTRVWSSYDYGTTWEQDLGSLSTEMSWVLGIGVMPNGTIYAARTDRSHIRDSVHIFRRRNGDTAWTELGTTVGPMQELIHFMPIGERMLLIHPNDYYWVDSDTTELYRDERDLGIGRQYWGEGGVLYASNNAALVISRDSGMSWSPVAGFPDSAGTLMGHLPPFTFYGIGWNPTETSDFRFIISTDAGATWSVTSFPYGPLRSTSMVMPDGTFLYATSVTTLRTTDRGATWDGEMRGIDGMAVSAFHTVDDSLLVMSAGTFGKIFSTTDLGTSWTWSVDSVEIPSIPGFYRHPGAYRDIVEDGRGRLFASSELALHRSDDQGQTWRAMGLIRGIEPMRELSDLCAGGETIYAMPYSAGSERLWRSVDGGESWDTVQLPYDMDLLEYNPVTDAIYGRASIGRWYESTDRGETWGRFLLQASFLVVDTTTGTLYAGSSGELADAYRYSVDNGASWITVELGNKKPRRFHDLMIQPDGTCFVLDDGGDLYRWRAEPFEWTRIENRGEKLPVRKLGMGPGGRLLLATDWWGLRTATIMTDDEDVDTIIPGDNEPPDSQEIRAYPNPTGGSLSIRTPAVEDEQSAVRMSTLSGQVIFEKRIVDLPRGSDGSLQIELPEGMPELVMMQVRSNGLWSEATMVRIAR